MRLESSPGLAFWLKQHRLSLAVTTYQASKLILLGLNPAGRLSGFERTFDRCMGLWANDQTLWLASSYQLWRMENVLEPAAVSVDGYDCLYVPKSGLITGDLDVHDIAVDSGGKILFINTLFSCLATESTRLSFEPVWRPSFVSTLAAEDRCHLNGLAMEAGRPRYVTACSTSNEAHGWRADRVGGGCVVDVNSNEIICDRLSMPHSPRLHDDRLWLLNSGTGYLGYVEWSTGRFIETAFCPGYARGLAFHGAYAIVGVSKCRNEGGTFNLPLDENLRRHNRSAQCGLVIIDLARGEIAHSFAIAGPIQELYDVAILPNVTRPKAIGLRTDEIRDTVWFEEGGQRQCWTAHGTPETNAPTNSTNHPSM